MKRTANLREFTVIVERDEEGFYGGSVRGSHHFHRHPEGSTTVVPCHAGETVGPGVMRNILRDVELSPEEFEQLL